MAEEITMLGETNWILVIIPILTLLSVVVGVLKNLDFIKDKLGIKTKHDIERELLNHTADSLNQLIEKQNNDIKEVYKTQEKNVKASIEHDQRIEAQLTTFMEEMRVIMNETRKQMSTYADNRVHDREQSRKIQNELTNSIKVVADGGKKREEQIAALMAANRELVGKELDRCFDRYIKLKGIPSDEYDEFVDLYESYRGCKGNHNREKKFNYCTKHLPILPTESKLLDTK